MTSTLLSISALKYAHAGVKGDLISNCSFEVLTGDVVGLVGENGTGKTTLLKLLSKRLNPSSGSITWQDDYFSPGRGGVFLEQGIGSFLLPWLSFAQHRQMFQRAALGQTNGATDFSSLVDGFADRACGDLSGGERQLTALALIFCLKWKVALLDEPFTALDRQRRRNMIVNLVWPQLVDETHKSAFIVSHQLDNLLFLCNRVLVLTRSGRVEEVSNDVWGDESLLTKGVPSQIAGKIVNLMSN